MVIFYLRVLGRAKCCPCKVRGHMCIYLSRCQDLNFDFNIGGTNEQVIAKMYSDLEEGVKQKLKVYWYTGAQEEREKG